MNNDLRVCRTRDFSKAPAGLFARLHRDERGAVTLETIMIIGAIALPILIFTIKYGWPRVKEFFTRGMNELEAEAENAIGNT